MNTTTRIGRLVRVECVTVADGREQVLKGHLMALRQLSFAAVRLIVPRLLSSASPVVNWKGKQP